MTYSVEISIAHPKEAGSDEGMPRYRLPGNYVDAVSAEDAARSYIEGLGKNLGAAMWRVLDPRGKVVGQSS